MDEKLIFTKAERTETLELLQQLRVLLATSLQKGDEEKMLSYARKALKSNVIQRDVFGLNPIHQSLKTAILAVEEEGLKRDGVLAILLYNSIKEQVGPSLHEGDEEKLRRYLQSYLEQPEVSRDVFGLNPVVLSLQTAKIVVEEIGLRRDAVLAILLHASVEGGFANIEQIQADFGESVARILHGLKRIRSFTRRTPSSRARTSVTCCCRLPRT